MTEMAHYLSRKAVLLTNRETPGWPKAAIEFELLEGALLCYPAGAANTLGEK